MIAIYTQQKTDGTRDLQESALASCWLTRHRQNLQHPSGRKYQTRHELQTKLRRRS